MQVPPPLVGCLLDVSGSMRNALETGYADEQAIERLQAVLRAALKLARAERHHNPDSLMFIGAFGMNSEQTPVVDLCGFVDELLKVITGSGDGQSGHDRLVALANEKNVPHVTKYIKTNLTATEALIVHSHLQRVPKDIQEFVAAIPPPERLEKVETVITRIGAITSCMNGLLNVLIGAPVNYSSMARNLVVDNSGAMKFARRILEAYLQNFKVLEQRPVSGVIALLERLEDDPSSTTNDKVDRRTLLEQIKPHIYGRTFMQDALRKSLKVFCDRPDITQRALLLVSDGLSTDGDPWPMAEELKQENVTIATIFLTDNKTRSDRRLYDKPDGHSFDGGQLKLFRMASKVSVLKHPVSVLAAIGWSVPSSGDCALYATVCSSRVLEEFCSMLLSARFGSGDALLDIIGKTQLDAYIDDEHVRSCNNPSDQGHTRTCYAHATAAILHMALIRIYEREGGCPSIAEIRSKILNHFPPKPDGESVWEVLKKTMDWYRPLRCRMVDEDGARQAVLHRRPVLATFGMADSGWTAFATHFETTETCTSILTKVHMASHQLSGADVGSGHAVVLTQCDPRSLTFLNSWGHQWGNNGSFSIENASVLDPINADKWDGMRFIDVYWYEQDLTAGEQKAYQRKVDETVSARAAQYPSFFELEVCCPCCHSNAPIAKFTGGVRHAVCPSCRQTFKPEPGYLMKALYIQGGLRGAGG